MPVVLVIDLFHPARLPPSPRPTTRQRRGGGATTASGATAASGLGGAVEGYCQSDWYEALNAGLRDWKRVYRRGFP